MARWTPDPSFYPSPRLAMEAPQEEVGYVAFLNPDASDGRPDALGVLDLEEAPPPSASSWASSTCPMPAMSCTISAGTHAAPPCAPGLRTRTWSGATSWCRACAPRGSMSWTSGTIPGAPSIAKVIEPEELIHKTGYSRPHTSALRSRGDLHERAGRRGERRRPGRDLPARLRDVRAPRPVGGGARPAALQLRLLVAPGVRHTPVERVGHARHVRERGGAREAAGQGVRPSAPHLGPEAPCAPAGHRPRRRAPDGAGATPGPRSAPHGRLRGRGGVRGRPERIGMALVAAPRRLVRGQEGDHHPGRAQGRRRASTRAEGLRRRTSARDRHQPLAGRPLALRVLLGHGRAAPVRRVRSGGAEAHGHGRARRHRQERVPSGAPARSTAGRRWSR